MLELRPGCECCGVDLPPSSGDATICSFECTFCRACVETRLGGVCPNCGGGFAPRPVRPAAPLEKYPNQLVRYTVLVAFDQPPADLLQGQSATIAVTTSAATVVLGQS